MSVLEEGLLDVQGETKARKRRCRLLAMVGRGDTELQGYAVCWRH